jgi:hypothetical protein
VAEGQARRRHGNHVIGCDRGSGANSCPVHRRPGKMEEDS